MPVGRDCWLCLSAIWHHHRGQACGSWSFWRGHVTGPSLLTIIIAVGHFSRPLATRLATIKRRGQQVAHLCCDCICIVGRWGKFFKFCTYDTGHAHLLATAFVRSFFFLLSLLLLHQQMVKLFPFPHFPPKHSRARKDFL